VRHDEVLAHACLSAVLGPDRVRRVWPQSHGEHDFDICDEAGRLQGIVEVSSTVDPVYQGTLAALDGERSIVPRDRCRGTWRVWPKGDARVRLLKRRLDSFLCNLEARGLTSFDWESTPDVIAAAAELGLESGTRFDDRDYHVINLPGRSGHVDAGSLAAALAEVGSREDNLRKLSAQGANERHLFVVVEFSALAAYCSFESGELCDPAVLDQRITHVWAARSDKFSSGVLLCARNGGPWSRRVVSWDHRFYCGLDA